MYRQPEVYDAICALVMHVALIANGIATTNNKPIIIDITVFFLFIFKIISYDNVIAEECA
jgi:hypothetical protein